MAKADLLRVQDVRDAYRLIGECRDLGRDPALWQTRMLEGLRPLILEGDTETQIASQLRLSQATTHQYVTALYRHFGVRSRAQLMAHAIKRAARADWKQLHAGR